MARASAADSSKAPTPRPADCKRAPTRAEDLQLVLKARNGDGQALDALCAGYTASYA